MAMSLEMFMVMPRGKVMSLEALMRAKENGNLSIYVN